VELTLTGIAGHVVARIGRDDGADQWHERQRDHRQGTDKNPDGELADIDGQRNRDQGQGLGLGQAVWKQGQQRQTECRDQATAGATVAILAP